MWMPYEVGHESLSNVRDEAKSWKKTLEEIKYTKPGQWFNVKQVKRRVEQNGKF